MHIKGAGAPQHLYFWTREIGLPILQDNQPESASFQVINYHRNKGKYCVKYIYFYNIKFTKYTKFTKFKI